MFSESEIEEEFKMDLTKLVYINNFGLASYFKDFIYSKIKVSNYFVILFCY